MYSPYDSRRTFEEDGSLALYSDSSQRLYTRIKNEDIFLKWPEGYPNEFVTKSWFGDHTWDFIAVEKEEKYIKLINRAGFDHLDDLRDAIKDVSFEVLTFDLKGDFIASELPHSSSQTFLVGYDSSDAKRIKNLIRPNGFTSELETWALSSEKIRKEYLGGDLIRQYSGDNRNGRLEEWAYYKYQELYPDQPMLKGFGVREAKESGDKDNSDLAKLYAPEKFNKKAADKITNFNPSTDTLEIDTDSFGLDSSATFAAGKNMKAVKKTLAKQDFDFLYDQKKGGLYFNENGADKSFGDGGIIAILKGAPDLTSDNLEFI